MRWAHDKSADDDGKPVNDVIVQFHYIENCRSVLAEVPFIWGNTEDLMGLVAHRPLVQSTRSK